MSGFDLELSTSDVVYWENSAALASCVWFMVESVSILCFWLFIAQKLNFC